MFGYAAFAQTSFASFSMLGTPASVTLTGQELFIYVNSLTTTTAANVQLTPQMSLVASQGVLQFNSAYALNGQAITAYLNSVGTTAAATTTLDAQLLQLYQGQITGAPGYSITGIAMVASQGALNTTAASNVVVAGEALNATLGNINAAGIANVALTGQYAAVLQGIISGKGNANATITGVTALININNLLVWGVIPTPDDPVWQTINTAQTDSWIVPVNDGNTVVWTKVIV